MFFILTAARWLLLLWILDSYSKEEGQEEVSEQRTRWYLYEAFSEVLLRLQVFCHCPDKFLWPPEVQGSNNTRFLARYVATLNKFGTLLARNKDCVLELIRQL